MRVGRVQVDACDFWRTLEKTTEAVLEACADLKVLGKREFRLLLAWRLKVADAWAKEEKARKKAAAGGDDDDDDDEDEEAEEDEEAAGARAEEEMSELERLAAQRKRSKKRKEAERRRKVKERMSLGMQHPGDRLDISEDFELFSINKIKTARALAAVTHGAGRDQDGAVVGATADVLADDEEDDEERAAGGGGAEEEEGESDEDGRGYVDRLDAELDLMYQVIACFITLIAC